MDTKDPEAHTAEQLFLDIPICQVLSTFPISPFKEPWATMYIDAIGEKRFGDPIWARYHIFGTVENGLIDGSNKTVLEAIKEDALEYRVNEPEEYSKALMVYATTSTSDGHTSILDMIMNLEEMEITQMRAELEAQAVIDEEYTEKLRAQRSVR
ncbi:hypothetical protein N7528_006682 [Penicillium herquei]|nr:hypothetical protein N7528_006682 [Penicillium herquei]